MDEDNLEDCFLRDVDVLDDLEDPSPACHPVPTTSMVVEDADQSNSGDVEWDEFLSSAGTMTSKLMDIQASISDTTWLQNSKFDVSFLKNVLNDAILSFGDRSCAASHTSPTDGDDEARSAVGVVLEDMILSLEQLWFSATIPAPLQEPIVPEPLPTPPQLSGPLLVIEDDAETTIAVVETTRDYGIDPTFEKNVTALEARKCSMQVTIGCFRHNYFSHLTLSQTALLSEEETYLRGERESQLRLIEERGNLERRRQRREIELQRAQRARKAVV